MRHQDTSALESMKASVKDLLNMTKIKQRQHAPIENFPSQCSKPRGVVHHSIQRKSAGKVDSSQTSLALGVAIEHEPGNLKLEQHLTTQDVSSLAFRKATGV